MIKSYINTKNILTIFIFIFISAVVSVFLKYNVVAGDDIWQIFFMAPFFEELANADHGRYLAWIQMKLIGSVFPIKILHIHPNSFICTGGAILRGIAIALLSFTFALFPYINRKRTWITPILAFFVFIFYANLVKYHNINEINNLSPHYGYQFGLLLYGIFWLYLSYYYLSNSKKGKLKSSLLIIFAFLCALNDTYAISGFLGFLFFIFFSFVLFMIEQKEESGSFISIISQYLKQNLVLIYSFLTFMVFTIFTVQGMLKDKGGWISNWFDLILDFIPQYYEHIFKNHQIFWIPIIIFMVLIITSKPQKQNNKFVLPVCSMLFGVLVFFVSLITGGTESYYVKGEFWIVHNDLQLFLKMVLLASVFALFGHYFNLKKDNFLIKIMLFFIAVIYITYLLLPFKDCLNFYIDRYKNSEIEKKVVYKNEKMYMFYLYRKEPAYLPVSTFSYPGIASAFWVGKMTEETAILDEFEMNRGNPNWDKYSECVEKIKKMSFEDSFYHVSYIQYTYNIEENNLQPYYFIEDEKAYEQFYEKGGTFSDDEINYPNFNRLYDKNFVLNLK